MLHEAARSGLGRLCARLLERCPNLLTSRTLTGDSALHLAVSRRNIEAVRALLTAASSSRERGELLAARNNNADSPLSLALGAKDRQLLAALVEAGADLETRNESGYTALHQAILKEDSESAIFLLEHGADMNARYYLATFFKIDIIRV